MGLVFRMALCVLTFMVARATIRFVLAISTAMLQARSAPLVPTHVLRPMCSSVTMGCVFRARCCALARGDVMGVQGHSNVRTMFAESASICVLLFHHVHPRDLRGVAMELAACRPVNVLEGVCASQAS